jgi:hypothetical protein
METDDRKLKVVKKDKTPSTEGLFLHSCKIMGIAELLNNYSNGEIVGTEALGFHGISRILLEIGEDLYKLSGVEGDGDDD